MTVKNMNTASVLPAIAATAGIAPVSARAVPADHSRSAAAKSPTVGQAIRAG
jgi:hypothetical protein